MIRSLPPAKSMIFPQIARALSSTPAEAAPQQADSLVLSTTPAAPQAPLDTVSLPRDSSFVTLDEARGTIHCAQPERLLARRQRLEARGIGVIAVRHGESEANASGGGAILSGRGDSPLTAVGQQQARQAADQLYQSLGGDAWLTSCVGDANKLPVLYSSPLSRAFNTGLALVEHFRGRLQDLADQGKISAPQAQSLAQQIHLHTDADLQEIDFGTCEGQDARAVSARYPNFGKGVDFTHRFPGGEAGLDVMNRMDRFFEKMEAHHPGRTVVFFGHTMTVGMSNILLGQVQHNDQGALMVDRHKILNAQPMVLAAPVQAQDPQDFLLAR